MSAPWAFGRCGPILEANGFQPLPISLPHPRDLDLGKRPPATLVGWQHPAPAASRLPQYAGCGTGVLTATTPAIDIDVRHPELADTLDRMVVSLVGEAPVRFGAVPKRLRVCRTATPFAKIATADYQLPGDQPGDKGHKLEVLADGQQCVVHGIHPLTGNPYAWPDENLLNLERDDLPELTLELATRVRDAAEAALARIGTVIGRGAVNGRPAAAYQPGIAPRQVRDLGEARQVLDVLRGIDPSGLDYSTWIKVGHGIKAALGEHGREVWLVWSRRSAKHGTSGKANTPERMWRGIKPKRCGWRYLERLARELNHG